MFRALLLFCISFTGLIAEIQNVELLANSVSKEGSIITAQGEVVIYSERYLITAERAIYDEQNGDLELFGNINMLRGASESSRSEHARINLRTDEADFQPFFLFDQQSDIWIQCENAIGGPAYYLTQKAIVSSCNVQDPDWKIGFSTGRLNRQTNFLHLYNTLFYIQDVPVFYLPYFAFSTDKTRRTGLLIPSLGYGSSEGLYYKQPMYIAEDDSWDLELDPQIRTSRGMGIYSTLRFVDSPYSKGSITLGHFREQADYAEEEAVENRTHEGYEIEYERSQLFKHLIDDATQDALWLDFTYLKDIDYLTLKDNEDTDYDDTVTSRLNYYITREYDYLGLYGKYYIETDEDSNDETLQELPTLHYHRFSESLILPNLLYSIDSKYHNYTRKEGITAQQYEFSLPISYHFSILDEFLNISVSENIYATQVKYGDISSDENEDFFSNYHKFSLYTDLAKAYENFYHTMYVGVDYILPSWENGGLSDTITDLNGDDEDNFISTDTTYESLTANLVQYFYDSAGKKRIRHSLSQPYYFEDSLYKYGTLENELAFYIGSDLTIRNEVNYSHEYSRFSKVQSSLAWQPSNYMMKVTHTYEIDSDDDKESYLNASFSVNHGKYYKTFGKVSYDFEDSYMKEWQLGITFKKKCWDYTITYKEEVTPSGTTSTTERGVFIMFTLVPLGAVSYDFSMEETDSTN